jgi:hypothetical protein
MRRRRTPGETVIEWLERLRWLHTDDQRVSITRLGRAVLAALEDAEQVREIPVEIVLDPGDELAYARIIGAVADAGPCALVDPYFSIENLLDVIQRTEVERVLIKPDGGRVSALSQAVSDLRIPRQFEIRSSDEFHDRFVIPNHGPVRFVGTSLRGVGRRLAVTGLLNDGPASHAIRHSFEEVWNRASVTAAASPPVEGSEVSAASDRNAGDGGHAAAESAA